ncbi:tol-pal system protein YbgF [Celeribacter marinus]|uniref:tol-pal system protein YbgF n=1 Tax=Celeribacter marinus TaxID=1397108 RepID=UPI00317A1F7A
MKRVIFGAVSALCILTAQGGFAQDTQTLADIRQEAAVLSVEITKLTRELSTTGAPNTAFAGESTLERVDLMEAALSRLTAKVEELEYRIGQVVKDGTNQLDDLNFRLCELEAGCDIGALPPLEPLGGVAETAPAVASGPGADAPMDGVGSMAMTEQSDFDHAMGLYEEAQFEDAAAAFEMFAMTYTGGSLTGESQFMRGEALTQLGQTSEAARAYLDSFSTAPEGDRAPSALLRLGMSLAALGQTDRGCVMLTEVGNRFPGAPEDAEAQSARQTIGCP